MHQKGYLEDLLLKREFMNTMWATLLDFVEILREMFSKRSYCTLLNSSKK